MVRTIYACDICGREMGLGVLVGIQIQVPSGPLGKVAISRLPAREAGVHLCGECSDELLRILPRSDD